MVKYFYVLIVEDDKAIAKENEEILKELKFINKVDVVNSNETAIAKIEKQKPNLIISNYKSKKIDIIDLKNSIMNKVRVMPTIFIRTEELDEKNFSMFQNLVGGLTFDRIFTEEDKEDFKFFITKEYQESTDIDDNELINIIKKQIQEKLKYSSKKCTPYMALLMSLITEYMIKNKIEYDEISKQEIYLYYKNKDKLDSGVIKEVQETVENIIKDYYTNGSDIATLTYEINKDEILKRFFNEVIKNVKETIIEKTEV